MVKIGTHNGSFHADELLACTMLKLLPKYKEAQIVRTRDPGALNECDIVVDVGGEYDPARHRYDHHQKSFTDSMNSLDSSWESTIKLSSAGLVYFHFGREVIASVLESESPESDLVSNVYKRVHAGFIEEIDAIDNGISTHDEEGRYTISTNLSRRVGGFNPKWNEKEQDYDTRFSAAMDMVRAEFLDKVNYYGKCWYPARSVVLEALSRRNDVHSSGRVIEFPEGGVPWKEHLFQLEAEQGLDGESNRILYAIYTDQKGMWRIQCVSVSSNSFENRLSLPAAWRGVRDADLEKVSGIEGATFVHAGGFIGGNKTRDGVLKMVDTSLRQL